MPVLFAGSVRDMVVPGLLHQKGDMVEIRRHKRELSEITI
jgi:hypothetical protein